MSQNFSPLKPRHPYEVYLSQNQPEIGESSDMQEELTGNVDAEILTDPNSNPESPHRRISGISLYHAKKNKVAKTIKVGDRYTKLFRG